MTKYAAMIAMCGLLGACSGSGVSTSARDDMADSADDGAGTGDADGGDDTPGDGGGDDTPGDGGDGGDDTPGDGGGDDTPGDGGDDASDDPTGGDSADDAESDGVDDNSMDDDTGEPATFDGVWLSEGDNVAPLLVELTNAVSITATFTTDTFTVFTIDGDGNEVSQSGVYLAELSDVGDIYTIILEQTVPQPITVEGIYEVDNSVSPAILRYEVVQTSPSVGAQPPTPELGFGGTSFGADLTQIFVRQ